MYDLKVNPNQVLSSWELHHCLKSVGEIAALGEAALGDRGCYWKQSYARLTLPVALQWSGPSEPIPLKLPSQAELGPDFTA